MADAASHSADLAGEPLATSAIRRGERRVGLLTLCLLALAVGVITGVGAVALRALIALFHNASYLGVFSFRYDANILEGPSRFGDWVFFSPIIGGLIVVWIVENFAPEAKGHGVPEVMDSIFYKDGNIRWQVAVVKSLASVSLFATASPGSSATRLTSRRQTTPSLSRATPASR